MDASRSGVSIQIPHYEPVIFFLSFLKNIGPICGATDTPVFVLLVTSALGFKARVDHLASVFCHLHAMESSVSHCGVKPADLLAASVAAKPITSTYL